MFLFCTLVPTDNSYSWSLLVFMWWLWPYWSEKGYGHFGITIVMEGLTSLPWCGKVLIICKGEGGNWGICTVAIEMERLSLGHNATEAKGFLARVLFLKKWGNWHITMVLGVHSLPGRWRIYYSPGMVKDIQTPLLCWWRYHYITLRKTFLCRRVQWLFKWNRNGKKLSER